MSLFIFQITFPTLSFALTGGPSSPETAAFTPVGSSELVDLTTGDFSYNIPLMTVPGPNGGYPISMGYKSGVSMEQEASWAGLGWDISVGAINRNLRGLPDDFKNDEVTQAIKYKETKIRTVNFDLGASLAPSFKKEIFGNKIATFSLNSVSVSHNNYTGLSGGIGGNMEVGSFQLGANFNTKDGISVSPNYSFGAKFKKLNYALSIGAGFSTTQGFSTINFGGSVQKSEKYLKGRFTAGMSFAKGAPIGEINAPQIITTNYFGGGFGTYATPRYNETMSGRYSETTVQLASNTSTVKGFGYLYLESATEDDLMDFHKENNLSVYDYTPVAYLPVLDNDVYSVSGQGVGGSFRAHRGDIPMLKPQKSTSNKSSAGATGEIGVGTTSHTGVDASWGSGQSMTGKWGVNGTDDGKMSAELEDDVNLQGLDSKNPLYQPFYFDFMGKQTQSNVDYYNNIEQDNPVLYNLKKSEKKSIHSMNSKYGEVHPSSYSRGIKTDKKLGRTITTNHISYRTRGEITKDNQAKFKHIIAENQVPNNNLTAVGYSDKGKDHHINEISVTNTSGTKYVYGLPAYNLSKEDVIFSTDHHTLNPKKVDYTASDASISNGKGLENYYKSTSIKDYVYSYLLTATYSDDYVDLKNDGPTDDDFGYWCKFNYSKINATNTIKWRAPFTGANYIEGNISDDEDDKASFSYGEKQQYYLNSIETKTHVAVFEVAGREDNYGANSRDQQAGSGSKLGSETRKLVSIKLYSKKDTNFGTPSAVPIKEVHFEYDYSLCQGVENNVNGGGKLTLKKVYFVHQKNTKGKQTPYTFEYGINSFNPSYNYLDNTDRWGNYQTIPAGFTSKTFPYTNQYQSATQRKDQASAWNLTKINLPSGGNIEVEYESDSYTYVQNKPAAQMFELIGFGRDVADSPDLTFETGLAKVRDLVFFKRTDGGTITTDEVKKYLNKLDHIYFKAFVNLRKDANEYVSGYFRVDPSYAPRLKSSTIACFKLQGVEFGKAGKKMHPIQKAACQHLHERPDLEGAVQNPIKQLRILFGGPIKYYKQKNKFCRHLVSPAVKKSIIRLNADPAGKYGGGNRVAAVKVNTGWGETYGQKYSYVNEDGTSSGVADYEPIIGGEENPLKVPVNYNGVLDYNSYKGINQFFIEKPYCEAYYPGAVVKYGRVITESLTPTDVGVTGFNASNLGGVTVNEYYTSKDFPVYESHTGKGDIQHFREAIPVPFGLDRPFQSSKAYSQGFVVELNDMAGKPKSVATYSYSDRTNLSTKNAKTRVEYIYHRDKKDNSKLAGDVLVLTQDGDFKPSNIGRKEEFYVHQQEDFDYNKTRTLSANLGIGSAVVDYITPIFQNSRSIQQRRTLVTNKVIYKSGLLKEVRTNDNGRKTISKNLAYDAYTGEALVQVQENDWDKPVYSYNYAGHWKYSALAGKYKNYRAGFKVTGSSPSYSIDANVNVEDILQVGDVLNYTNGSGQFEQVYVTKVDLVTNTFDAKDIDNIAQLPAGKKVTIVESGYRNMQSAKVGNIVSLSNPLNFPFAGSGFMNNVFSNLVAGNNSTPITYNGACDTLSYTLDNFSLYSNANKVKEWTLDVTKTDGDNCKLYLTHDISVNSSLNWWDLNYISTSLVKISETEYTFNYTYTYNSETYNGRGLLRTDCNFGCELNVLHASSTELSDIWTYDYTDLGDPEVKKSNGNLYPLSTAVVNPYAFGQRGKWKAKRSWVNQVIRKQSGTKGSNSEIDKDGEYDTFKFFKWNRDTTINQKNRWAWTNLMTKYSPYGYDMENKNPLNIYSSELYGYNNSLVTAVSANASYDEIAFDDFETNHVAPNSPGFTHGKTGHFDYNAADRVVDWKAHTGNYSFITTGTNTTFSSSGLNLNSAKKYVFSCWVYVYGGPLNFTINLKQSGSSTTLLSKTYNPSFNTIDPNQKVIDKWVKMEIPFDNVTGNIDIEFVVPSGFKLIDDVRIHPFNSSFKSFVYNPQTLKLQAELDNLNYATFYNYDEEGKLIQVKKETDKGIVTVKSSRDNIAH